MKITLDLVNPPVTRQIVVPLDLTLDRLHLVMQAAMGWTNSHLWEFRTGAGELECRWGLHDPDWRPMGTHKESICQAHLMATAAVAVF